MLPGWHRLAQAQLERCRQMSSNPGTPDLPVLPATATAALCKPANGVASVDKAAFGWQCPACCACPRYISHKITLGTTDTTLPFTAAVAGRHIKVGLLRPCRFTQPTAADSDIQAWLLCVQEYLTVSGIDASYWVVFAIIYLENAPLQLSEAWKTQLHPQPDVALLESFSAVVPNLMQHAKPCMSCHYSASRSAPDWSVADHMAAHNVCAAIIFLPMQLCIHWWELRQASKCNQGERWILAHMSILTLTGFDKQHVLMVYH